MLKPISVRHEGYRFFIEFADGRALAVPYALSPRLAGATLAERRDVELAANGLHWPRVEEDLSIEGLLAGRAEPRMFAESDGGIPAARLLASGREFSMSDLGDILAGSSDEPASDEISPGEYDRRRRRAAARLLQRWRRNGCVAYRRSDDGAQWRSTSFGRFLGRNGLRVAETLPV